MITKLIFILGFMYLATGAQAKEVCVPFPPKQASITKPSVEKKRPVPTAFSVVRSEIGAGPELIFLGDSLTAGTGASNRSARFPQMTAASFSPSRSYEIFAIGGQSSKTLATLFDDVIIPDSSVGIIWIGRNNYKSTDQILSDVTSAARKFKSQKYFVLAVTKGRFTDEQPGGSGGAQIENLNAKLKEVFRDKFVDVDQVINCDDYADNIHLNDSGYGKVAAAVTNVLKLRGW